jgi:hypothetical protein
MRLSSECVLWLDGHLGNLGLGHARVWGGLDQGLLQFLEFYGCHSIVVESLLDVSPGGDDAMWPWYLRDQVGIVWDCHELGEHWPPQESVVCSLEISGLKLYVFRAEVFPSPNGHEKEDLADGGCCCPRDYAVKLSPTGT